MNEMIQKMMARKSVRAFSEQKITPEVREQLLQAALRAPTAGNMSLYTIIEVTDPQLKARLSETCDHQPFIAKAPMILVFCGDYHRWYSCFAGLKSEDYPVRKPAEGDFLMAFEDAVIAAQTTALAAESLGLGSCYIGDILENYEIHRQLLHLPDYVAPVCMLVIGYPTESQKNRKQTPRFAVEDLVHENGYRTDSADRMREMVRIRENKTEDGIDEYLRALCTRKWNSAFSEEMSRSSRAMLQAWCTGDKPGSWESIDDGDFAAFRRLIHVLRGPDGCPWDRVQTFESLKDCIKNESDEVLEGIDRYQATGDAANLCEELGDVLMHVVLLSDLAEEKGLFQLEDVVREIGYKMLRRHPHVFGEEAMRGWKGKVTGDIGQLPRSWDEIKQLEKSIFRS